MHAEYKHARTQVYTQEYAVNLRDIQNQTDINLQELQRCESFQILKRRDDLPHCPLSYNELNYKHLFHNFKFKIRCVCV